MSMTRAEPMETLRAWLAQASGLGLRIPNACVLSTVGLDGFPNARGVAIKDVTDGRVVVTGPLTSRKGRELAANPRCALTVWWDGPGRQVRIQGTAALLSADEAGAIFAERSRESRLVAVVSRQGEPLHGDELEVAYAALAASGEDPGVPNSWGGWAITPHRVEFMEFSDERFHSRTLFERDGSGWTVTALQP